MKWFCDMNFSLPPAFRYFIDKMSVRQVDRMLLAKHMATMVKAGIPIDEALDILAEEASSPRVRKVLLKVLDHVNAGEGLAESMSVYPAFFPNLFVHMVRVGEESGTLEENLKYLAMQLEHDYETIQKVKSAAAYPLIVLVLAFFMGGAMSFFILPKLIPLFLSLGVDLPLPTRIVLFTSKFMVNYGAVFFPGVVVGVFVVRALLHTNRIRPYWHRVLLRIPAIGKLVTHVNLARSTRTLGILLKSGLPIIESLNITKETIGNEVYRSIFTRSAGDVELGMPFSEALKKAVPSSKVMPTIVPRMINVGERTGTLDDALLSLAEFYEKEVDTSAKTLSTALEPILIIGIGGAVALVALSIIMPIYSLTGSVSSPDGS